MRTTYVNGEVPFTRNWGTFAELIAMTPTTEIAFGYPSDPGMGPMTYLAGQGWFGAGGKLSSSGDMAHEGSVLAANITRHSHIPMYGTLEIFGSSSVANGQNQSTNGIVRDTFLSPFAAANKILGDRYEITNYGYSGTGAAYQLEQLRIRLAAGAAADITVWWGGANDMGSMTTSLAALATMKTAVAMIRAAGSFPIVVTPHLQIDNANKWAYTSAYDQLAQEWCIVNRVRFISGAYALCAHTDKIGTAKSGVMSDNLHFNALGSTHYVTEILRTFNQTENWRLLGISNGADAPLWSGQLHTNPRMTGTGAASGTGISGTRCANVSPTRYSGATILCACSVGTNPYDGAFMDLDISIPAGQAGAAQAIQMFEMIPLAAFLPDRFYVHMVDYEIVSNSGVLRNVQPSLRFSGTPVQSVDHVSGTAPDVPQALGRVTSRTHRWSSAQSSPAASTSAGALLWTVPNVEGTAKVRFFANGTREAQPIT